jgi:hypothetical protein
MNSFGILSILEHVPWATLPSVVEDGPGLFLRIGIVKPEAV